MGTVLPLHPLVIHQTHIRLVDEGRRLEAVIAALTSHVAVRQAVELRIDDRRQLAKGALVSVTPGAEKLADIVGRHGCRFRGPLMTAGLNCRARIESATGLPGLIVVDLAIDFSDRHPM